MIGKITLGYTKGKSKKVHEYESDFLFDPQDPSIRYAYPMLEDYIRISFGGDVIDIDYDETIWVALRKRFEPIEKSTGFHHETTEPKIK